MRTGRPTKYRKDFPARAGKLWANGATDAQVAQQLKINHDTLKEFVKKYPEFSATRAACKEIADDNVEKALYDRAIGSVLPDVHIAVHEGAVIVTPLKKHFPPDVQACSLWLRNRKPQQWRDKTESDITLSGMPEDLVKAIQERAAAKAKTNGSTDHTLART